MEQGLIFKTYNGNIICFRQDGYINLSDLTKIYGKQLSNWKQLKGSQEYLEVLSNSIGIPKEDLIQNIIDGNPEGQGFYGHPKVAVRLSQWISTQLLFWLESEIEEFNKKKQTDNRVDTASKEKVNNLSIFNHEQFGDVQVIEFEGAIYFNPDIVAKALGYNDTKNLFDIFRPIPEEDMNLYVRHFTYQELSQLRVQTEVNKNQRINWSRNGKRFLTEPGIFMLLNKSEKPNAYPFQKWVNTQVLPKLKNDGYYISDNIKDEQLKKMNEELELKRKMIDDNHKVMESQNKLIESQDKTIKKLKSNPSLEKTYQKWLHDIIGGEREVRVGVAMFKDKRKQKRIDIMTHLMLVECKKASKWKEAMTQIEYYKMLCIKDGIYNNQFMCLFLFDKGNETEDEIPDIKEMCLNKNIQLFYYKNMADYVDADELIENINQSNVHEEWPEY